jgi:predicted metal-dependent peptidase
MLNGSGRDKLNRHGYGWTEFARPIRYTYEKYKPDVIVYLTDGYADLNFQIPKVPIVWVITNDQAQIPKRLGRTVRLKVNQEN